MAHHYESPRQANGMVQSPSSLSSISSSRNARERGIPQDDASSSPLVRSDLHADCQKLEMTNRRMRVVFVILAALCVVTIVVYAITIICLFVVLFEMNPDQAGRWSGPQGTAGSPQGPMDHKKEFCVDEKEMHEFKNIWDPEDRQDIKDMLGGVGFAHYVNPQTSTYCFSTLEWVPKIMGKINKRVQRSVSYIEDQQEHINRTVNDYILMNNSTTSTQTHCQNNTGVKVRSDPTNPADSVFAHYFLDTHVNYDRGVPDLGSLQWTREAQKMSLRKRIDVNVKTGHFTIRHSGFYFIYSHLVFRADTHPVHRVIKTRSGEGAETKVLLESVRGPASFLQGVFMLNVNDSLLVHATATHLDTSRDKTSYFGVYLIRT